MKWNLGRSKSFSIIPDIVYLVLEMSVFNRNANKYAGDSSEPVCLQECKFLYFHTSAVREQVTFWIEQVEE